MLTLGIVNTYDKLKVHDAHYRSIARAACSETMQYIKSKILAAFDKDAF